MTNWLIGWSVLVGKLLQELMFGELRLIETEHLYERAWFTVTNLLMTLAMFRSENNLLIFGMILALLFMKVFHWILGDRLEYVFQQQQLNEHSGIRKIVVNRTTVVLGIFLVLDYKIIMSCIDHAFLHSTDVFVVFGLDFLMVYLDLLEATLKYGLNVGEMVYLKYHREDEVWEDKVWINKIGMILISFFRLIAVGFVFVGLIYAYIIPVNFTRDVYVGVVKLVNQLKDFFYLVKAARDLEAHITDATEEDLIDQEMCIICRDDMTTDVPSKRHRNAPKKLPCGHVLHFGCLKSWLERSHRCPTCRREVFSSNEGSLPEWNHHHPEQEGEPNNEEVGNIRNAEAADMVLEEVNRDAEIQPAGIVPSNSTSAHTTGTSTGSTFSLRMPQGSVIPPDWTLLPLRRLGNAVTNTSTVSASDEYEVRLNKDATCKLHVVKREREMDQDEFDRYVVKEE
ncbi:DEKNAAC100080 [Brettanomyces naardenensis]|uniref:RING-type E3 ubiquitin transferase n=1 Tax=Brettanomyces naardenensis TaxID=13370 RepID=A0A448YGH0_BRENA|nr:DEKNAAC100080 [Brettanomyces naardenensis]